MSSIIHYDGGNYQDRYCYSACGEIIAVFKSGRWKDWLKNSTDKSKVTCKNCKKTKVYNE